MYDFKVSDYDDVPWWFYLKDIVIDSTARCHSSSTFTLSATGLSKLLKAKQIQMLFGNPTSTSFKAYWGLYHMYIIHLLFLKVYTVSPPLWYTLLLHARGGSPSLAKAPWPTTKSLLQWQLCDPSMASHPPTLPKLLGLIIQANQEPQQHYQYLFTNEKDSDDHFHSADFHVIADVNLFWTPTTYV